MSSVTEVQTFSDIYTEILNKMRQPTNITAITAQAKRYANTALLDMVLGFEYKLPWLEREAVLLTRAPYTTGTVDISAGNVTVNGTATAWATTDSYQLANVRDTGKLSFGDGNIYAIDEVLSGTQLNMQSRYVASEDLDDGEYTYFEDEYALAADFLKPIDFRRFTSAYNIPLIGRNEFRRLYPRPNIAGIPKVATLLDKAFAGSTTPVVHVQFYPYPSAVYMLPYSYITKNLAVSSAGVEATSMSSDTDEPALPMRYRGALVSFAIAKWYRDKKDDSRSDSAYAEYMDAVGRVVNDQRIGANTQAKIVPRVANYSMRSVYRGGLRGRYSVNDSFDEFRS